MHSASDPVTPRTGNPAVPGAGAGTGTPAAARRRSPRRLLPDRPAPRPRVEASVNEFTGTMSWRIIEQRGYGIGARHTSTDGNADVEGTLRGRTAGTADSLPRTPGATPWSARAAALRSAGLDPSRAPANGAAPIPTHPAVVRAALSVDVAALTPEQRQQHLARLGTLRSAVAADLTHGIRTPMAVASRLRSTTATPAHAHALTTRRTTAVTQGNAQAHAMTYRHTPPGPTSGPRR